MSLEKKGNIFMKQKIIFFIVVFFGLNFFYSFKLFAQTPFSPWGTKIKIADQLYQPSLKITSQRQVKISNGIQQGASFLVSFFQKIISPQDGPSCHFKPVCSLYSQIALRKHGFFWGVLLTGDRILRCNPYTLPAKDLVPEVLFGLD